MLADRIDPMPTILAGTSRLTDRLRCKEWEGDAAVVYNIASGDTHVVDSLAMELLRMLAQDSRASAESMLSELRAIYGGEVPARVERSLGRLQELGLVAAWPR